MTEIAPIFVVFIRYIKGVRDISTYMICQWHYPNGPETSERGQRGISRWKRQEEAAAKSKKSKTMHVIDNQTFQGSILFPNTFPDEKEVPLRRESSRHEIEFSAKRKV